MLKKTDGRAMSWGRCCIVDTRVRWRKNAKKRTRILENVDPRWRECHSTGERINLRWDKTLNGASNDTSVHTNTQVKQVGETSFVIFIFQDYCQSTFTRFCCRFHDFLSYTIYIYTIAHDVSNATHADKTTSMTCSPGAKCQ